MEKFKGQFIFILLEDIQINSQEIPVSDEAFG